MGVTFIPGPRQFGADGGGGDASGSSQGLVQLAMAVKAFKMQEAQQKQQFAQKKLETLTANPQLLVLMDPKDVEKTFGDAGYKISDKPGMDPNAPAQSPAPGIAAPLPIDTNQMSALANATQGNKSGAQAGSPATPNAANKAPGGGVTPTIGPTVAEHLASQAKAAFNQKFGAVAPLYANAMSQIDQEKIKAQGIMEIEELQSRARHGDFQAMGRLAISAGHSVSDSDMRAMIASSNMNPDVIRQAMDFALGNETPQSRGTRLDNNIKSVYGNPDIMTRLVNPLDATKIAQSITNNAALPEGIEMRPFSLAQLQEEAKYEDFLIKDVQIPYDYAHLIGRSRTLGVDDPVPNGMKTLLSVPGKEGSGEISFGEGYKTGSMKETEAKGVTAQAAKQEAENNRTKVYNDGLKIQGELATKQSTMLNDRLATMIEARKAKHPWPDEVERALINEVAVETGLMPEQVSHWYDFMTGKDWAYTPIPASDVAQEAAGKTAKKPKKGQESDSLPMQIIRSLFPPPAKPTL